MYRRFMEPEHGARTWSPNMEPEHGAPDALVRGAEPQSRATGWADGGVRPSTNKKSRDQRMVPA